MAMACILSQHALYLKLKACMNKDFCTGEIWKLINLCCLSKLKVGLNHMSLYRKKKENQMGLFGSFKKKASVSERLV